MLLMDVAIAILYIEEKKKKKKRKVMHKMG